MILESAEAVSEGVLSFLYEAGVTLVIHVDCLPSQSHTCAFTALVS